MRSRFFTAELRLVALLLLLVPATGTGCSFVVPRSFPTILTGKAIDLRTLQVTQPEGKAQIDFNLNEEGTRTFAEYTDKHVGQYVAITLNRKVLTCPKIMQPIRGGGITIQGEFTLEEAQLMADEIKKDPGRLEFIEAGDSPLAFGEIIQATGIP